jgi:hypothetical protein
MMQWVTAWTAEGLMSQSADLKNQKQVEADCASDVSN